MTDCEKYGMDNGCDECCPVYRRGECPNPDELDFSDVHHRCRCLDRNFTFEEWSAYLRETGYKNLPVFTAGRFQFNIHDVCCNPNLPVRFERGRGYRVEIRTAKSPNGRWGYGYDIAAYNSSSCCGARYIDEPAGGFPSEREAIYDGLLYAQRFVEKEIKDIEERGEQDYDENGWPAKKPKNSTPTLTALRQFLADILKQIDNYDPRQLTLFEI